MQADKLLSQEFQVSVEGIIGFLHPDRQIMLYSATFPVAVRQFKDKFLSRPHIINLMEELTLRGITQVPCRFAPAAFHISISTWAERPRLCSTLQWKPGAVMRPEVGPRCAEHQYWLGCAEKECLLLKWPKLETW